MSRRKETETFPPDVLNNLPVKFEARCKVCQSELRPMIDRMIAGPYTSRGIARFILGKDNLFKGSPENERDVDRVRKSVERHAERHVTVRQAAIREILLDRAAEVGLLQEDTKNSLSTMKGLLDLYVQRGLEQVTAEGSFVKHTDILDAVKILKEFEQESISAQIEVMTKQLNSIIRAIRVVVPEEWYDQITAKAEEFFYEDPNAVKVTQELVA